MLQLIIAEKPSFAKNIVAALGSSKFKMQDGYYESTDYIVTFAYGHLFGLKDLEEYNPNYDPEEKTSWTLEGLPFRPHEFQFKLRPDPKTRKVDPGVKKQFQTIKKLCARKDVECVVNAGDADREGEIIIRIILEQAGNAKPVWRLWVPDQTPDTIRAELRAMKRDSNYDNYANEGYARTYIDWLYGINLTRYASLKSDTLLRVGRVIVPIVKAIYDRDMAIKNFVPKKYLGLSSKAETNGEVIELSSKRTFDLSERERANALADTYNRTGAVVKSIDKKKTALQAGKLYSLSKLQGVLGKRFKMSPKESLAIVQDLYEAGYVSYPRTNSEYLATTQRDSINAILAKLKDYGYKVCPKDLKKSIYDDSKIESHSALTPTNKLAKKEDLKDREWQVYSTIFNRFLAVFCSEDCLVDRTTIEIQVGDMETFKLKGDVFITKGWMQYDETGKEDKILPRLAVGDTVNVDFKVVDRETKPPAHYTVDSLNKYLKNPFKEEKKRAAGQTAEIEPEEDEAEEAEGPENTDADREDYDAMFEGVELGTEATRTGIIDTAIHSKYIDLKKNTYTILPDGIFLIETLHKLGIDMGKEKTAELGRVLKQVYRGELSIEDSVSRAFMEIRLFFTAGFGVTIDAKDRPQANGGEPIGTCPKCGANVVNCEKFFRCENKDCGFTLWKDNKFLQALGKKLTTSVAKKLLKGEKALLTSCKSAKNGHIFACWLTADFSGEQVSYSTERPEDNDASLGACPKCGSPVLERDKGFSCNNSDCSFVIWKETALLKAIKKNISPPRAKALLKDGRVLLTGCISPKTGNAFDCWLIADFSGEAVDFTLEYPTPDDISLGSCPKCGSPVVERTVTLNDEECKVFGCSNKTCKFALWENDKYFQAIGRKLTGPIVKKLLSEGRVNLKDCVSRKTGGKFSCCVSADFRGQRPDYKMQRINTRK